MSHQIDITKNGTTTLATAGKYCDRNIDVNTNVPTYEAELAEQKAISDGIISGTIDCDYVSEEVTKLKSYAFQGCTQLTNVSFPNCKSIGSLCFSGCESLESVNLPNCETFLNSSTFDGAKALKTINIQNLTTMTSGKRIFTGCRALEELNAPNLVSVGENTSNMFNTCPQLKKVYYPKLGGAVIGTSTFANCSRLVTVVLGGSELNTLETTSAFSNSSISKGTGYIYVPDDLVDTYKTATNWSTYADQIKPISELEE